MELIDTHTHLFLDDFEHDRIQIIQNAIDKGVSKMLLPNIDNTTLNSMFNLCREFPEHCFPMAGLHPTSVKEDYLAQLAEIEHVISERKIYAIGEVGIDLYWDKSFFQQQRDAFLRQTELSLQHNLPLVIHCRDSFTEIIDVLMQFRGRTFRGIFHSFTESLKDAELVISLGFYLGINGIVTYKKSDLPEVVKNIPLEKIVLETDSPYLTPVPFRGKRNESSYLIYIAQKIADIKNISVNDVAELTTKSAMQLFNL